jgi:hypothetical protein
LPGIPVPLFSVRSVELAFTCSTTCRRAGNDIAGGAGPTKAAPCHPLAAANLQYPAHYAYRRHAGIFQPAGHPANGTDPSRRNIHVTKAVRTTAMAAIPACSRSALCPSTDASSGPGPQCPGLCAYHSSAQHACYPCLLDRPGAPERVPSRKLDCCSWSAVRGRQFRDGGGPATEPDRTFSGFGEVRVVVWVGLREVF